jgi:hypothetical protein
VNRKSTIPVSALVTFGTISLADIQHNGQLPGSREWLGFVVVFTMLAVGADFGIPFAGGFAILVMITVLLTRGLEALKFVTGKVADPKKQNRGNRKKAAPQQAKPAATLA